MNRFCLRFYNFDLVYTTWLLHVTASLNASIHQDSQLVTKEGITYLEPQQDSSRLKLGDITYNYSGLFGDNKAFGEIHPYYKRKFLQCRLFCRRSFEKNY